MDGRETVAESNPRSDGSMGTVCSASAVRVIDHSCMRCISALPQVKPPIRRRASRASRPRIFRVDGAQKYEPHLYDLLYGPYSLVTLYSSLGNFYFSPRQFLSARGNENARSRLVSETASNEARETFSHLGMNVEEETNIVCVETTFELYCDIMRNARIKIYSV